ncbi:SHOCT domain-containing protein [Streptomonospora sp. PA3]|uniref:SHOCT domain-containing protein n=1 Tax=Streptomonospora sp. PA3 TaxID=2607326 RepID=UPI001642B9D0|nr:SHOCT domain-containing protein [Streptomonospora sp. PA3]
MRTALTAAAGRAAEPAFLAEPAARFHHGPPFPMIGAAMLLVLLLLGVLAYLLITRFKGRRPPWAGAAHEPPEYAARKVLAERFARGDITVDEFLERASVLNWTPGAREGGPK